MFTIDENGKRNKPKKPVLDKMYKFLREKYLAHKDSEAETHVRTRTFTCHICALVSFCVKLAEFPVNVWGEWSNIHKQLNKYNGCTVIPNT